MGKNGFPLRVLMGYAWEFMGYVWVTPGLLKTGLVQILYSVLRCVYGCPLGFYGVPTGFLWVPVFTPLQIHCIFVFGSATIGDISPNSWIELYIKAFWRRRFNHCIFVFGSATIGDISPHSWIELYIKAFWRRRFNLNDAPAPSCFTLKLLGPPFKLTWEAILEFQDWSIFRRDL